MNFQNLEYFVTIADEGNITRAAERMHISQQALSGSISRLESELGCVLFSRHPQFMLTYSGKCFYKTATEILDLKNQSDTLLADINGNACGELKLGVSVTRGQALLPLVLPEFYKTHPKAEVTVMGASTKELENALSKGLIDVAIGFMPMMVDNAEVTPILRDRLFLVLPKSLLKEHFGENYIEICKKYEKNPDITLFKDLPFVLIRESERIRALVNRAFAEKKLRVKVKTETYNIQTAFSLAAEGLGLAVCPEMYLKSEYTIPGIVDSRARKNVIVLPFFGGDVYDTIGIGYNKDRYLSKTAKDFIDVCIEKTKTLDMPV